MWSFDDKRRANNKESEKPDKLITLYDFIISPLIFVYDILFTLIFRFFQQPVSSIIALSFLINLLVLPLYVKADAIQKEEQAKKVSMAPWVNHIKRNFHGDEQFMMLQAYNSVEHYSPFDFLKESVPLFLQIPFFMAAYRYISSLSVLEGASFGPIENLLKPDNLLQIGNFSINVLPILMTFINLMSGAVYSKASTKGLKVQIVVTALVFLILLYNSPSGLAIYWTANNLFSLAKNIVFTLSENNKRYFKIAMGIVLCIVVDVYMICGNGNLFLGELVIVSSVLYMLWQIGREKILFFLDRELPLKCDKKEKGSFGILFFSELALASLFGLYIPSTVLMSSVHEFMDNSVFRYELLKYPVTVYFGLFLLWFSVIYWSKERRGRQLFSFFLLSFLVYSLLNQFAFSKSFGTLYTDLTFDKAVQFPVIQTTVNAEIGLMIVVGCSALLYKRPQLTKRIASIVAAALLVSGIYNVYTIYKNAGNIQPKEEQRVSYDGLLRLSKTGKNVIVLMLDRAIGSYVPYIFDEKPALKEAYQGFVFYPNTISFGTHTNFGTPALFGGYEYTPVEMNKRDKESLSGKHNEALKLMPTLFIENGYDVTVCDPPYAGYKDIPDLSIYKDNPGIQAYNLKGEFSDSFIRKLQEYNFEETQKRNFLVYSLYRTAPLILREFIYDNGNYIYNFPKVSFSKELIDSFSTLTKYKQLTKVDDERKGSFLLLQNETPHNPTALNPPDYAVASTDTVEKTEQEERIFDGRIMELSTVSQWNHYCINVAAYAEVGKWLDYLRNEGVYDNTRIILVADHGYYLSQFPDLIHPDGLDIESLNPTLMIKDFDSHDPWSVSTEFMTNADVPYQAMKDLIDNPINPFTGDKISDEKKKNERMFVTDSNNWRVGENNGTTFNTSDGNWWSVHDSIFDMNNWKKVDESEVGK